MKDESKNVFPTSDRRTGGTPEKPLIQSGKTGKSLGFLGTAHASVYELNEKTKNEIYNMKTGKRNPSVMLAEPYDLEIPGLSESRILHLTKQQAKSWGDKREEFLELSEKYLTLKQHTTAAGPEAEKRRNEDLKNQLAKILELQNSMLDDVETIAKDTLLPSSFERLKGQIERARLQQYDPNLMSGIMGKVLKATGIEETVQREIDNLENQGKAVAGGALNFMSKKSTEFNNAVTESTNNAREEYSRKITEITQQNKNTTNEVSSEPIIITNNVQQSTNKPPDGSKPASAWNNDFFVKHYYDVSNSPFNIK
jgi:hypothetical protein